jgi:hypothetical protein
MASPCASPEETVTINDQAFVMTPDEAVTINDQAFVLTSREMFLRRHVSSSYESSSTSSSASSSASSFTFV